jgi:hypothetical protein
VGSIAQALRKLFGVGTSPAPALRHIPVLVRGTLFNAEAAVSQLQMLGIGGASISGAAAAFGGPGGLSVQSSDGRWLPLDQVVGRWILIIPEDAHAVYGMQLEAFAGGPVIDGRVNASGAFPFLNINKAAEAEIQRLADSLPPLEVPAAADHARPAEKAVKRVVVGKCASCGRELRMKENAIRPKVHLTCKCGAANEIASRLREEQQ